jgi:drug/metabolite transporter (DMT)-like permease
MDLAKIFFTPPNTKKEKIILVLMMVITFMIFFGPICFSDIPPFRAVLLACMPTLSVSWGVMILLRARFRKKDFCK